MNQRVGIIGCGVITERLLAHLALPSARQLARVVALADPLVERAQRLAAPFTGAVAFSNHEDMLSSIELDAVLVASPIPFHADHVEACLAAGCHVHCQKTLATTATDALRLARIARDRSLQLAVSPGQMLLPAYARARELIGQNAIGQIFCAIGTNSALGHEVEHERRHDVDAPSPAWYYARGGGPLLDMGIYSLHAMIGILGEPTHVTAMTSRPLPTRQWSNQTIDVSVDDNAQLIVRFPHEVLATLTTSYSAEPEHVRWGHLAISGERGTIEIRRSQPGYELITRTQSGTNRETHGHGLGGEHERLREAHVFRDVQDLLLALTEQRPASSDARDACIALSVIDAAERSATTGRVEPIDTTP